jgi:hypothetical protein
MAKSKSGELKPLNPDDKTLRQQKGSAATGGKVPKHLTIALEEAAQVQARALEEIQKLTRERESLKEHMAARENFHQERAEAQLAQFSREREQDQQALQGVVERSVVHYKQKIEDLTARLEAATREAEDYAQTKLQNEKLMQQVSNLSAALDATKGIITERDRYKSEVLAITEEFQRVCQPLWGKRNEIKIDIVRRNSVQIEDLVQSVEKLSYFQLARWKRRLVQSFMQMGRRLLGEVRNPLFDAPWYLENYPDVRLNLIDPYLHYMKYGWKEGRQPNVMFAPAWYLSEYPDIKLANVEPLTHYLRHGAQEGRMPHPLFPVELLGEQLGDGMTPLERLLRKLGRLT